MNARNDLSALQSLYSSVEEFENDWELELVGDAPWLELVGNTAGSKGKNRVNFNLTPNTDTENGREAKLKLTSGEVSNEIVVRQLPAKKEVEE